MSAASTRRRLGPSFLDPAPLLERQGGCIDEVFAEVLGVSRRQILRWRAGVSRVPRLSSHRYAAALGLRADELWPRQKVAS